MRLGDVFSVLMWSDSIEEEVIREFSLLTKATAFHHAMDFVRLFLPQVTYIFQQQAVFFVGFWVCLQNCKTDFLVLWRLYSAMSTFEVLCEKLDALNEDNWEQLEESNSFTTRSHQGTNENHQPCNETQAWGSHTELCTGGDPVGLDVDVSYGRKFPHFACQVALLTATTLGPQLPCIFGWIAALLCELRVQQVRFELA